MTPTELAWLEQGGRVATAIMQTDAETRARMLRYMAWRWGSQAVIVAAIRAMLRKAALELKGIALP